MSHIFISYAHDDDKSYLTQLLDTLQNAGFDLENDIWYDKHMEVGNTWKPQIDRALEEAFAVVVILAEHSVQSLYVTFEWSFALGSSIPLFPLLFGGTYDDVHKHQKRLLDEHVEDCRNGIPDHVIETLKEKRSIPPDIDYLNKLISMELMPAKVTLKLLFWLFDNVDNARHYSDELYALIDRCTDHISNLYNTVIPEMMVEKSHAFTSKQKRLFRNLIGLLREFWKIFHISDGSSKYSDVMSTSPDFDSTIPTARIYWNELISPVLNAFKVDFADENGYDSFVNYLFYLETNTPLHDSYPLASPRRMIQLAMKDDEESTKRWWRLIHKIKGIKLADF